MVGKFLEWLANSWKRSELRITFGYVFIARRDRIGFPRPRYG